MFEKADLDGSGTLEIKELRGLINDLFKDKLKKIKDA
jgi:hypothetical protein